MKKLLLLSALLVLGYIGLAENSRSTQAAPSAAMHAPGLAANSNSDQALAVAFSSHQSNVQVQGGGIVTKMLPDDAEGSRHQRFIIALGSGQTLLVAHNIDLPSASTRSRSGTVSSSWASTNEIPREG